MYGPSRMLCCCNIEPVFYVWAVKPGFVPHLALVAHVMTSALPYLVKIVRQGNTVIPFVDGCNS